MNKRRRLDHPHHNHHHNSHAGASTTTVEGETNSASTMMNVNQHATFDNHHHDIINVGVAAFQQLQKHTTHSLQQIQAQVNHLRQEEEVVQQQGQVGTALGVSEQVHALETTQMDPIQQAQDAATRHLHHHQARQQAADQQQQQQLSPHPPRVQQPQQHQILTNHSFLVQQGGEAAHLQQQHTGEHQPPQPSQHHLPPQPILPSPNQHITVQQPLLQGAVDVQLVQAQQHPVILQQSPASSLVGVARGTAAVPQVSSHSWTTDHVAEARRRMNALLQRQQKAQEELRAAEEALKSVQVRIEMAKKAIDITDMTVHQGTEELTDALLQEPTHWNAMYRKLRDFNNQFGHVDVRRNLNTVKGGRGKLDGDPDTMRLSTWIGRVRLEARRPAGHVSTVVYYYFDWVRLINYILSCNFLLLVYTHQN